MGAPPGYRPSAWVHLLHQLPRADFQLRPVPSGFAPQEQEYQQVGAGAGVLGAGARRVGRAEGSRGRRGLGGRVLCSPQVGAGPGLRASRYLGNRWGPGWRRSFPTTGWTNGVGVGAGIGRVRRWGGHGPRVPGQVVISRPSPLSAGIGIGFYGNSETSDGVSQLSSALLHANHTLSAIDHLVLETVERLGEAVRTELTSLEEVLAQRTELVAAARGARRQAEAVTQQLQGLAFWRGVPLSPLQVAEDVSFVEEYRWLAYVLLLLLELLVCLFTLLGLAKQSKWLVIVMAVMSLLVLVLSWGSMGLEAATAVGLSDFCSSPDTYILNLTEEETGLDSDILNYYFLCNQAVSNPFQQRLTLSQRALANIHSQLQGLEREAVPQFPDAQKPLLSLEETLNVTEGNFHQLVALLHCRGLHKDYGAALRGLCEDALEGLLLLLLFSLLSAGALATALCSLPRAWALFPPSDDYDDTDDDDPFNPQESKRFVQWQSSI
uniref:protein tweety homolog 1 n=1 Tax=Panthera onca TaxID=9690 RepID=UPI0029555E04|nr:protein tweety homolog 1 [Panthera onca]